MFTICITYSIISIYSAAATWRRPNAWSNNCLRWRVDSERSSGPGSLKRGPVAVTMKRLRSIWLASVCAGAAAVASAATAPATVADYDPAVVTKGAHLAAIGNCASCHTAEGGKPYAGGRPLSAPLGTVYSTNITPDTETGIGKWTEGDFVRAMHDGVDRGGRDLYPAFPYDHFTKVSDDDVYAFFAFVIIFDAVSVRYRANSLMFSS